MRNELLGTLRLSIIDNLRAEIREREGVIADLTRSDEIASVPDHAKLSNGDLAFVDTRGDTHVQRSRPTHGDAIAEVRKRGRKTSPRTEKLATRALNYIERHPGCKGEQLRESIGATTAQMPMIRKNLKGKFKTKGARRGLTYWPKGGGK